MPFFPEICITWRIVYSKTTIHGKVGRPHGARWEGVVVIRRQHGPWWTVKGRPGVIVDHALRNWNVAACQTVGVAPVHRVAGVGSVLVRMSDMVTQTRSGFVPGSTN